MSLFCPHSGDEDAKLWERSWQSSFLFLARFHSQTWPWAPSGSPWSPALSAPLRWALQVTSHVRSVDPTALHRKRMAAQWTVSGSGVRRAPLGCRGPLTWPCRREAGSMHHVNRHSAGAAVVQSRCSTPGSGVGFAPDVWRVALQPHPWG